MKQSVRGCDKRKYEALIHNNILPGEDTLGDLLNDDDEESEGFKDVMLNQTDNEQSVMFYSMMSESTAFDSVINSHIDITNMSRSPDSTQVDGKFHGQVDQCLNYFF